MKKFTLKIARENVKLLFDWYNEWEDEIPKSYSEFICNCDESWNYYEQGIALFIGEIIEPSEIKWRKTLLGAAWQEALKS